MESNFEKEVNFKKIIELLEKYDLFDIWRIRIPFSKRYIFRKNHFSWNIERQLNYIFVSNTLKEPLQQISILPSFCSDYSPVLFSYNKPAQISLEKKLESLAVP